MRRFNTRRGKASATEPVDIGRPVGHLRGRIETPRLEAAGQNASSKLCTPIAEEVQDAKATGIPSAFGRTGPSTTGLPAR